MNHKELNELSLNHYNKKEYQEALKYAKDSVLDSPNCHFSLWQLAGCLSTLRRYHESNKIYKRLIKIKKRDECVEEDRLVSIITDSIFRIGYNLYKLGEKQESINNFLQYQKLVSLGAETVYNLDLSNKYIFAQNNKILLEEIERCIS